MAKTIAMADNNTIPLEIRESNRLLLRKDVVVKGRNDTYKVKAKNRIGAGGESQVYLAKSQSNRQQVIVKIYDTFTYDPLSRSNRKKVLEFLYKNSDYKGSHIMPLLDDGEIEIESNDGEDSYKRPLDIIPYCKDGELKHCSYQELKNKVIPEVLHALNLLHSNNLVHRDIKPQNLYMYDGEVVLADFGTTSQILNSEDASITGTQRGTPGYTAPEISDKYFVVASDYYSLGCTIASLYKGEHVYQRLIDSRNTVSVNIEMRRKGLPLECPKAEKSLQTLVNALVMSDSSMRAGYEDVNLWLRNPDSFSSSWNDRIKQGYEKTSLGFNFEGNVYNNETELTDAMLSQWNNAKRYLYRGIIAEFFKQKNPALSDKTIDIVEGKETAHDQDLGLARFLHYLNTTDKSICPIYWCGDKYESLADISTAISAGTADEEKVIAMLKAKFLSWKISKHENVNQDTIDAIEEIEELALDYPQLGYYAFMYKTDPKRNEFIKTADEYFKDITKKDNEWHTKAMNIINNDKSLAYLLCLGGKKLISDFKGKLTGTFISSEEMSDLLLLYLLFESICKDKISVREHYLRFGPHAYLYWFQQNLELYSFNSIGAKELEKKIKAVSIDKNTSIEEMLNGFRSLHYYVKNEFMPLLQNNFILTYMGIQTDKDGTGITTNNTYAFFIGNLYGVNVPIGYLKSIERRNTND